MGIDAATRIVGFFVSAIGVGLVFDGVIEALKTHGITSLHRHKQSRRNQDLRR
jgi:multiple antibiotic resistance protein